MRLLGSLTYDWHGQTEHVVAGREVVIRLEPRWVAVGRLGRGTRLVAWEWVRELSGWSPVAEGHR